MTLTPSQKRALEWLPSDGRWIRPDGDLILGTISLRFHRPDLVECDIENAVYRLTPAGIALKAEIFP